MSNDLVKVEKNGSLLVSSLDAVPDYLKNEATTDLGLGQGDYIIPRIKLLQGLSPEVKDFGAKAGTYWHSGANKTVGDSFNFIVCHILKRVMVWDARGINSNLVAYSADGKHWTSGGNSKFGFRVKGFKEPIMMTTSHDVQSSGLLNFGTSNPHDPKSAPVATQVYEYLIYTPEFPELSPCLMGMYRTATQAAKKLNTQLLMLNQQRRPHQSVMIECKAIIESNDEGEWYVPTFRVAGYVSKETFDNAKLITDKYTEVATSVKPDIATEASGNASATVTSKYKDEEIPF